MRGARLVVAVLIVAPWAAADDFDLTMDRAIVITPFAQPEYREPSPMPTLAPETDLPLPPLDLMPSLGLERRQEAAQRIEAGMAEAVWRPPEEVGVTVRPAAELSPAAPAAAVSEGPRFAPILAEARDESVGERAGSGPRLRNDDGLVPKDLKNFVLPPPEMARALVTFRIEQSEPDPVQQMLAQPRRRRR